MSVLLLWVAPHRHPMSMVAVVAIAVIIGIIAVIVITIIIIIVVVAVLWRIAAAATAVTTAVVTSAAVRPPAVSAVEGGLVDQPTFALEFRYNLRVVAIICMVIRVLAISILGA